MLACSRVGSVLLTFLIPVRLSRIVEIVVGDQRLVGIRRRGSLIHLWGCR